MLTPAPAAAQQGGPGFLFRQPRVTLGISATYLVPRASSDLYDFVTRELTLDRSDFVAPGVRGDLAARVAPRVDLLVSVAYGRSETRSEFRDFVGEDDLAIAQTTTLRQTPVTVGARYYLRERGRAVSRFAWVPARWNAYVGAALGRTWYRFEQSGEFVDTGSLDIFFDTFTSSGSGGTLQVLGGAEVGLNNLLLLTGEARYQWADAPLGNDFVDFDDIDLSGLQLSLGFAVRF